MVIVFLMASDGMDTDLCIDDLITLDEVRLWNRPILLLALTEFCRKRGLW